MNPLVVGFFALLWWIMNKEKPKDFRQAFVAKIWDGASKVASEFKWPRDLIITQAAHESNWGRSELAAMHNNLFGIKPGTSWKGEVVMMPTREWSKEKGWVQVQQPFRKYPSWEASVRDLVDLITRLSRYQEAEDAAKRGDLKGFFAGLQRGGYATDPQYAAKLGRVLADVQTVVV